MFEAIGFLTVVYYGGKIIEYLLKKLDPTPDGWDEDQEW